MELLLGAGASADKGNRGGLTPLMAAALFCHGTAAAALLARQAHTPACCAAGAASPASGWPSAELCAGC